MKCIDKFRGCLIGGAAGDALGYAVEFLDEPAIFQKYGESGITEYELTDGVAQISDDTQMTLFTANGLLVGTTRGMMRGIIGPYTIYVSNSYKDWLKTQSGDYPIDRKQHRVFSWLINIPEMFSRRAPGNTCLSALQEREYGTTQKPINSSKGCGGIMRVAPVGLYFDPDRLPDEELQGMGAEVAAITHGHELGYIPAATLVHIVRLLVYEDVSIKEAVATALTTTERVFNDAKELSYYLSLMNKAITLAEDDMSDLDAIHCLGEGWVAEETLAIAVYCAIKYADDFDKALIAAVNHKGDSDSTGSVTGNIVGASLGMVGIPNKYTEHLELKDTILEMADDLYNDCQMEEFGDYEDEVWRNKYIQFVYPNIEKG